MTALCLYNNISRHIKITSVVLNFVTEICSNFLELKITFWFLNSILALRSSFLELKDNVWILKKCSRIENNVLVFEFHTRVEK